MRALRMVSSLFVIAGIAGSTVAQAIPAFARKYGTSCQTCHTVYPKLTPFGEAFRRNGYRFPGIDSDYIKQEPIPLGQEAYKQTFPRTVWPSYLPISVPIAVGFNGQAVIHPDKNAGGAQTDNGTQFTFNDLIAEAHLWGGGSFDDKNTFWAEVTFSSDGTIDVEHAQLLFNDLLGTHHELNLLVGRGVANINSFGPHSSYVADTLITQVPITALYGGTSNSFVVGGQYNGVEANGTVGGRFDYAVGLVGGANVDIRPTENVYGHVGFKLGGMRFDGEGTSGPSDTEHPWAETSLTVDAFAYHSNSHFNPAAGGITEDVSLTLGGGLRAQWGSLELNSGIYQETHNNAAGDGVSVSAVVQYNELSYVVFPWLVPAVRVEYLGVTPNGGATSNNIRIMPGIAALVRPNIKLTLVGQIETASGAPPPGGWGPAGGMAVAEVGGEFEALTLGIATAW